MTVVHERRSRKKREMEIENCVGGIDLHTGLSLIKNCSFDPG